MKTLIVTLGLILLSLASYSQYDDIYYSPSDSDTVSVEKNTYITNNYYNYEYDYDDYYYTQRIHRFHRGYWHSYYSPYYLFSIGYVNFYWTGYYNPYYSYYGWGYNPYYSYYGWGGYYNYWDNHGHHDNNHYYGHRDGGSNSTTSQNTHRPFTTTEAKPQSNINPQHKEQNIINYSKPSAKPMFNNSKPEIINTNSNYKKPIHNNYSKPANNYNSKPTYNTNHSKPSSNHISKPTYNSRPTNTNYNKTPSSTHSRPGGSVQSKPNNTRR